MVWVGVLPLVALFAALVIVPGWITARALGFSMLGAAGFAPVLGLATVGAWTLIWGLLRLPWGWVAYGGLLLVLAGLWLVFRLSGLTRRLTSDTCDPRLRTAQLVLGAVGVATFAAVQFWSLSHAMIAPNQIPHLGDADFHLQGALLVFETKNIFPVGALSDLYAPGEITSVYYPTLWHGLVALALPVASVVVATNALILVVSLIFWPISVAALGLALLPENRYITFVTPVAILPLAVFPGVVGVGFSILPFALSTITFPAGVAALIMWLRSGKLRFGAVYGGALIGGMVAQPTVAVMTAVAGGVALVLLYGRWLTRSVKEHRWLIPALVGFVAVIAGGFLAGTFRHNSFLVAMASYPRPQISEQPLVDFFGGVVAAVSQPWKPWWGVVILAVLSLLILSRDWATWVAPVMTVITSVAYIVSLGPDSTLRALTGPWYKDHLRLGSFAAMLLAVLASVAVAWAFGKILPNGLPLGATVAVFTASGLVILGLWVVVDPAIARVLRDHVSNGYVLDDQEFTPLKADSIPLMERLDQHFEPGDRLLSSHGNGGGFIVAYSHLKPFIPTRDLLTPEQKYLGANLDQIAEDPRVCEIINENNITAFMADTGRVGREVWGPLAGPPAVDTDDGFELVDQEGSIKVWRITACD